MYVILEEVDLEDSSAFSNEEVLEKRDGGEVAIPVVSDVPSS